jgi:hypothetical protein
MSDMSEKIDDLLPDKAAVAQLINGMSAGDAANDFPNPAINTSAPDSSTPDADGFAQIPAKPAVYACFSPDGAAIVAATTANLRNALKNRIANQAGGKSKAVNYADIAESIRFRCVGSAFAASWWYYRAVRTLFPRRYAAMLAWKPHWFVNLNPDADFPRFQISNTLADSPSVNIGPLATRRKARGIVESMEDLFDLCRYYDILRQAPHGKPCAYKELGKCPAPCDGSISMVDYRQRISRAMDFLSDSIGNRMQWFENQEQLIREAAARMDFRAAAGHKRKLDQADKLNQGKLTEIHNMDKWKYLILQRGKTRNWIAPFVAGPGWISSLDEVPQAAGAASVPFWMTVCNLELPDNLTVDCFPIEEIAALVTYHKYRPGEAGLYIPMDGQIDAETIGKALEFWLNYKSDCDMPEINSADPAAVINVADNLETGDE